MATTPTPEERLKSKLATLDHRMAELEVELAHYRKTIDGLLAQDLESSEENANLREAVWLAHQHIRSVCSCGVCEEFEQGRTELDGLWLYD